MQTFFEYSPEVKQALIEHQPIVALESTLITHGLPDPLNCETAIAAENIVRENGAIPATIAIINGKIKIGLTTSDLEKLVNDPHVTKASVRDIPHILTKRSNAGTTVAATVFCADAAGLKIFATGGIGGVHRGDDQDISADLIELSKTPMAVICAGAKAILDLPKTLEFLETFSIPVIGYRTSSFPAFYTAETPYILNTHYDDIASLAAHLKIHWQLNLRSGLLIVNPIPMDAEIPTDVIEPAIKEALKNAIQKKIYGKEITPYLLSEVATVTKGKSIESNITLIKNNVRLGALLAKHIYTT